MKETPKINEAVVKKVDFFKDIIKISSVLAKESKFEFELNIQNIIKVSVDSSLLRQAVLNLVDNAVKYGCNEFPIIISVAKNSDEKFIITISNYCEEISREELLKLFDRFYRMESSKIKNGGAGLGLAIVKSIALLHSGEASADYKNKNISISLTLPTKF